MELEIMSAGTMGVVVHEIQTRVGERLGLSFLSRPAGWDHAGGFALLARTSDTADTKIHLVFSLQQLTNYHLSNFQR